MGDLIVGGDSSLLREMEMNWPVVDIGGLVEEINAEYKRSDEPLHAAICYQKCQDLLLLTPRHGHFFIAHTHLILALLKHPRDPIATTTHLQRASLEIHTIQALPQNANRPHLNAPDLALLQQYHRLATSIYNEHMQFFSARKWSALNIDRIGADISEQFKLQTYELQAVDRDGQLTGTTTKFAEPILPLVRKSAADLNRERCEAMDGFWRLMCRELMKGVDGVDVRQLGGAQLVGLGGRGVFEFWGEIRAVWLRGGGDGGLGEREMGGLLAQEGNCTGCSCSRCVEQDGALGSVEAARDEELWVRRFAGYADTTRCGYQWDF
ncbi:hypothetical protein DSL72_007301 [Monilinia vaccinii-corymbosi]|uniref:Uncharacterized protein n=1 Tax=Monilinia vaccinii-corymbosi TaxID=61207 RepID=A0A8A3PMW3_9HELO|nr:hypothetical protein DSL72_007301 [Monilinia vaccinii-corymbosi]